MTNVVKQKRKLQRRVLHDLLDLLEFDQDQTESPLGGPAKLYSQLLVGTLIRSLNAHVNIPRSKKRARALGIAVFQNEVPKHERKLLRKRLKKKPVVQVQWDDEDDDGLTIV